MSRLTSFVSHLALGRETVDYVLSPSYSNVSHITSVSTHRDSVKSKLSGTTNVFDTIYLMENIRL